MSFSKLDRLLLILLLSGCATGYVPGPDKQGAGAVQGALSGAASGAVTGLNVGAGSGPGALVGAGIGAVAGSIKGAFFDETEEAREELRREIGRADQESRVQAVLLTHYERRAAIHPGREIFPADYFFERDKAVLTREGVELVRELAKLYAGRSVYSRMVVAAFTVSKEGEGNNFAETLSARRAQEFANHLIQFGIEPRRVVPRAAVISEPLVIDPQSPSDRFAQAIEITLEDRVG